MKDTRYGELLIGYAITTILLVLGLYLLNSRLSKLEVHYNDLVANETEFRTNVGKEFAKVSEALTKEKH